MDFRDQTQVGQHIYGVNAKTEPADDDQPATVALEFTGADHDGRIVAEGNLLIALECLGDSGAFLLRILEGLAAFHGQGKRATRSRQRPLPANAGRPWGSEHNDQLRQRWLRSTAVAGGKELIDELAGELGRTRSAVRAQLPRLGCDPDVPGRELEPADQPDSSDPPRPPDPTGLPGPLRPIGTAEPVGLLAPERGDVRRERTYSAAGND